MLAIIALAQNLISDSENTPTTSNKTSFVSLAAAARLSVSSEDRQDRSGPSNGAAEHVGGGGRGGFSSYLNSARQLLSTSLDAHNQARVYSSIMPNEDPRTAQMLRETIDQTGDLIQSYQHDGLSNMPPIPNVPGLQTVMRLPDKLLRAELSMLQDGIRMAQEMRERPLMATINAPKGRSRD